MSGVALILAAHGSRVEPTTNASLRAMADRIAGREVFDEVAVAFHHGRPGFAQVLDELASDDVIVVPVMTSEGHFSDVVLPHELARHARFGNLRLRITPPVGAHPRMVELVARRASEMVRTYDLNARRTCLAVVGHGTVRHAGSRRATERLAAALDRRNDFGQVLSAFLDEEPGVESILRVADQPAVVVIPFLISGGPHATVDIPVRLGLTVGRDASPPFVGRVGDRLVICDAAVGTDAGVIEIILDLAKFEVQSSKFEDRMATDDLFELRTSHFELPATAAVDS